MSQKIFAKNIQATRNNIMHVYTYCSLYVCASYTSFSLRSDDRYYDRGGRGPPPGRSRGFGHGWSDRDRDRSVIREGERKMSFSCWS